MNWIDILLKEFKKNIDILPIKEPPCSYCKYFKPHRKYNNQGEYAGLTLCTVTEMYSDFSCWKEIDNEKNNKD